MDFLANTDFTISDGSTSLISSSMNFGRVAYDVDGGGTGGSGGGDNDVDDAGDRNGERDDDCESEDEIDVFGEGCWGVVSLLHVSFPLSSAFVLLIHLSKSSTVLLRVSVVGLVDAIVSESLDVYCIDWGFDGLSGCCLPGGGFNFPEFDSVVESYKLSNNKNSIN